MSNFSTIVGFDKDCLIWFDLQILQNDIQAHRPSIDSVNEAGQRVLSVGGPSAAVTKGKLDEMNQRWDRILAKSQGRQADLEDALFEVSSRGDNWREVINLRT